MICSACHEPTRVTTKHWSQAEWESTVLEMLQEDPDVTQAERAQIVNYLVKNFGKPGTRINVNKAAAKEFESALELSAKDAEAVVHYREEKGNFKTLDDLKKVPGVDASKFEGHKEYLEF